MSIVLEERIQYNVNQYAKTADIIERFFSHIDVHDKDECWPWLHAKDKDGYGKFQLTHKIQIRAHRFMYMITYGPPKYWVLHTRECHNPPCVNPKHLYDGTAKQNSEDRDITGRAGDHKGALNGMSKLDEDTVRFIRGLCNAGISQYIVAEQFGVTQQTISKIMTGVLWSNVK